MTDSGIPPDVSSKKELELAKAEVKRLRKEVADLAGSINGLRNYRLMRVFDCYRMLRYRLRRFFDVLPLAQRKISEGKAFQSMDIGRPSAPEQRNYDVIIFSGADWRWRFQRPQQLACQWANHGYRVFFVAPYFHSGVNPSLSRPPKSYTAEQVYPGILELHLAGPPELHPLSKRMLEFDTRVLLDSCLAVKEQFQIGNCVCILEFPFWAPLALKLRGLLEWKIVYDFIDRFHGVFPKAYSVLSDEIALLEAADLVVASARLLEEDAGRLNANTCYIPNGVDIEAFSPNETSENPLKNLNLNHPVIGYFGALDFWFDVDLIYFTARDHPDWTFVIIGSGPEDIRKLSKLENIILVGEVSYRSLPPYLYQFDVCMIPFRSLPVTAATNPVKVYEYLAAGKPVVVTGLPELKAISDVVYWAASPPEFEQCIRQAISQDSDKKREQRRDFAKQNTWQDRFTRYEEAVNSLFETSARCCNVEELPKTGGPLIIQIRPSVIRVNRGFRTYGEPFGELTIIGDRFSESCAALVDEKPIPSQVVNSTELICQVPGALVRNPGCIMISIIDQTTWQQSNRAALLVERI
jgi:glycosyltransferase involved in cell wall biosynthesis